MTAAALGNGRTVFPGPTATTTSAPDRRGVQDGRVVPRASRRARWTRRKQCQEITSIGRVRRCGSLRDPERGAVLAVTSTPEGRRAGFEGLVTCGSVWSCPVCAAKVAAARAEELAQVLDAVHSAGGSAFMLTLTIRHRAGDRLGLDREQRARRTVLDQRRRWRNRLEKIDARRMAREDAEAMGWDVDAHQGEADDIEETKVRRDIARQDPDMVTVGAGAREQAEKDTAELAGLDAGRGSWDAVTDAWHAATSGRDWMAAQEATGMLGWARVTEVTDGATPSILAGLPAGHGYSGNGWHVHIHALLCFPADLSTEYVAAALGAGMHARWTAKARALGFDSSDEHGWDLRKTYRGDDDNVHGYLVKQAHEVTGAHRKEGKRRGGRTPMQLLADAVETYRVEDVARWWEWEAAAEGRRQLEWSRGTRSLRTFAGLGTDRTDEQVAEDDTLDGDQRLALPPDTWTWLRAHNQASWLLDAAEVGGLHDARRWLAGHELHWEEAPPTRSLNWLGVGKHVEAAKVVGCSTPRSGRPDRKL